MKQEAGNGRNLQTALGGGGIPGKLERGQRPLTCMLLGKLWSFMGSRLSQQLSGDQNQCWPEGLCKLGKGPPTPTPLGSCSQALGTGTWWGPSEGFEWLAGRVQPIAASPSSLMVTVVGGPVAGSLSKELWVCVQHVIVLRPVAQVRVPAGSQSP